MMLSTTENGYSAQKRPTPHLNRDKDDENPAADFSLSTTKARGWQSLEAFSFLFAVVERRLEEATVQQQKRL
jgi:hypothetical protein